ncbi:5'-nucleotidase [Streptomyces antnestii]|uniref:5'-nucleotidase n=1 Tax=Streptomyces antnestii TaxID=2494256 RepID=A0A437PZA5_9ACTN|nr:5'-nucleotidase [Streptomyces sp. San01]
MRTKPTMCKRMLRSVMAIAFSAGLAFGVFGTQDLSWSSAPTTHVSADLSWSTAPATHVSAGQSIAPPDLSWSVAPVDTAA